MREFLRTAVAVSCAAALAGCAMTEEVVGAGAPRPSGDVTMVVPFAAGGGSDIAGRAMARGLEAAEPGLRITVDNRDGGAGAVGYSYFLAKAGSPDYLLATETSLISLPRSQDVAFSHRDFTPVFKLGEDYTLLVARQDSPMNTCDQAVRRSKEQRVLAGISGAAGPDAIVFELMRRREGAGFDQVPYESGGETLAGLLGGQVELASLNPSEVVGQLRAGRLKALCVFADTRYDYPELAAIPTAAEQGVEVSFAQFRGVIAAGGLDPRAREFWIAAAREYAASPGYAEYVRSEYLQPKTAFGAEFAEYLRANDALLAEVVAR
ncbi:putative tricarboxylic transport membrane protein [Saccharopolyspora erythraea NRRL 2338]|uniref:Tripartite tricarboxylate transporter substrate binding protein n=1 Tax=Saccharopolyspora erythraea TaxID=1836 RepID=A0ABP3MGB6_SACER|nr:tripartite tricarboxylate transporter substrate binding protein [Saccharopolyspora erythraea]EQD85508.1 twin-arginine translocation pathway signal protein [Saccharopolyspora erythraea D]PFG96718.1 putative tricarboxylic transport membrane protein [Saccharopolyspora erythraea NRRL 2338]QRK86971.1 tripartite tricarboxylate transporter substrate binding protein [Saccharopolyspora erythraea]